MRTFLLSLLFTPLLSSAQKLILIDRNFQQPATLADTITLEQATKGALPIYFSDIQPMIHAIQRLIKKIGAGTLSKEQFDLGIGNTKCIVKTEKDGNRNRYHVVLNTNTGKFKTSFVLVAYETNKRAVQRINIFLDYLKNNASVITGKI